MQFKLIPDLPEFVAYTKRLAERPALQRQLARDEAYARQSGRLKHIPLERPRVCGIVVACNNSASDTDAAR